MAPTKNTPKQRKNGNGRAQPPTLSTSAPPAMSGPNGELGTLAKKKRRNNKKNKGGSQATSLAGSSRPASDIEGGTAGGAGSGTTTPTQGRAGLRPGKAERAARRKQKRLAGKNSQTSSRAASMALVNVSDLESEAAAGEEEGAGGQAEDMNGGPGPSTLAARGRRSPSAPAEMDASADFLELDVSLDGEGDSSNTRIGADTNDAYTPSAFKKMPRRSLLAAIEDLPDLTMNTDADVLDDTVASVKPTHTPLDAQERYTHLDPSSTSSISASAPLSTPSRGDRGSAFASTRAADMPGLASAATGRGRVAKGLRYDEGSSVLGSGASDAALGNGMTPGRVAYEDKSAYKVRADGLALPAYVEVAGHGHGGREAGEGGEDGEGGGDDGEDSDDEELGDLDGVHFLDSDISKVRLES